MNLLVVIHNKSPISAESRIFVCSRPRVVPACRGVCKVWQKRANTGALSMRIGFGGQYITIIMTGSPQNPIL